MPHPGRTSRKWMPAVHGHLHPGFARLEAELVVATYLGYTRIRFWVLPSRMANLTFQKIRIENITGTNHWRRLSA
jgi:hypothetical protein